MNVGSGANYYFTAIKTRDKKACICERCKGEYFKTYTGIEYKIGNKIFCSYNCREKYRKENSKIKEERQIMNDIYVGDIYKHQIRYTYLVENDQELKMGFFTIKSNARKFSKQQALNVLIAHFEDEKNRVGKRQGLILDTLQVRNVVLRH